MIDLSECVVAVLDEADRLLEKCLEKKITVDADGCDKRNMGDDAKALILAIKDHKKRASHRFESEQMAYEASKKKYETYQKLKVLLLPPCLWIRARWIPPCLWNYNQTVVHVHRFNLVQIVLNLNKWRHVFRK